MNAFTGYDGSTYNLGSRVELHPALDMWMRGARYGYVMGVTTPKSGPRAGKRSLAVKLDKLPFRKLSVVEGDLRAI